MSIKITVWSPAIGVNILTADQEWMSVSYPSTWDTICCPQKEEGREDIFPYPFHEHFFLCRVLTGYRYHLITVWTCSAGWNERNFLGETNKQTDGRAKVKWPKVQIYQKYTQFFTWLYNLSGKKMDSTILWYVRHMSDEIVLLVDGLVEIVIDHCDLSTEKLKVCLS